jgi:hypothetical protein
MAKARAPKKRQKTEGVKAELKKPLPLDARNQRRLLRFLNAAHRPEDLAYAPQNEIKAEPQETLKRPDVDEPMQERPREKLIDIKQAQRILEERDKLSPLYGFKHLDQLRELVVRERLAKYLEILSMHLGSATYGQWNDAGPIEDPSTHAAINVVHAALLRTGWVMFIEAACNIPVSRTPIWNRSTGEIRLPTPPTDNLYCSGHSFLSDGKLLVVGGGGENGQTQHPNMAWKFDPANGPAGTWEPTRDSSNNRTYMNRDRWYPTVVTLGDEPGRVLIASGFPSQMEIYSETSGTFSLVTAAGGDRAFSALYPGLHLLPGGEIFFAPVGFRSGGSTPGEYAANELSGYFDFTGSLTGGWADLGPNDRTKGMSVLLLSPTYPFAQVMTVGGGNLNKSRTYQIINLSTLSPAWGPEVNLPMASGQTQPTSRVNVNVVLLPDSTVFVSGGAGAGERCWLYNPATNAWSEVDEAPRERKYHSHALLLPTGEVMSCGWTNNTIDIFQPPYLFRGARPVIDAVPALVHHGQQLTIETSQASQITKVVLVRPMAPTHNTDSEQRVIQLLFHASGATTLAATAPNGWHPHATAQRGWYMLFILNGDGVPSEAKFIQLH